MSDHCEVCPEHSGIKSSSRLLVWLLAILIGISGSQAILLLGVKTEISGFTYRFSAWDQDKKELKEQIREIQARMSRLERYELGHREMNN